MLGLLVLGAEVGAEVGAGAAAAEASAALVSVFLGGMVMDVVVVLGLEAEDILLKMQLEDEKKVQLRLDRGLRNKGREEDGRALSRSRGEDWVFIYGGGVSWRDRVISLILPCPDGPPVSPCDLGGPL